MLLVKIKSDTSTHFAYIFHGSFYELFTVEEEENTFVYISKNTKV